MASIRFAISGYESAATRSAGNTAPGDDLPGRVRASVRVQATRDAASVVHLDVQDGEAVLLRLQGGPPLVLHPATARDLLLSQVPDTTREAAVPPAGLGDSPPAEVRVPAAVAWAEGGPAATRAGRKHFAIEAFDILTDLVKDGAAPAAAAAIGSRVDAQVEPGLYALSSGSLARLKGTPKAPQLPAAPTPVLVFVHGTFVETTSSFGKLWERHPAKVEELFRAYPAGVYALEHETLRKSPIQNALELARRAPPDTVLHLVTHSRGGLVAEVLARVCHDPGDEARGAKFTSDERQAFEALRKLVGEQRLRVGRVVRVACPARGTLLASKRLDALISILRWTLKLASIPIAPAIVEFLGEVAARRHVPEELPGLAAMLPDSPLVEWLNSSGESVAGDLRVVAGDVQADSIGSWIKQAVSDLYYRTDNDFVVQTSSMYGGAPRKDAASFFLDASGAVSHFTYFANETTARAIVDGALASAPAGFQPIGPLSWAGNDSSGLRGGRDPSKPAVFILPGILGTNLEKNGTRLWLGFHTIGRFGELAYSANDRSVVPESLLETHYGALIRDLADSHDVIPFPFDWRRRMEDEADRLALEVRKALDARKHTGEPVRILAHSMGGVLARTLQLRSPQLWNEMMQHEASRFVMLGVPHRGSYVPMQVLTRDNTVGNWLLAVGAPFKDHEARTLVAQMPGILQLQADLLNEERRLGQAQIWKDLEASDLAAIRRKSLWHAAAFELGCYRWGLPGQEALNDAVALRRKLDTLVESFPSRVKLVVGTNRPTPFGFQHGPDDELVYRVSDGGDGTVTIESATLPGIETWVTSSDHSDMAASRGDFAAYRELLCSGTTAKLDRASPGTRDGSGPGVSSEPAFVLSRPALENRGPGVPSDTRSFLAVPLTPSTVTRRAPPLQVTVQNGSLKFVDAPLIVGHYRSDSLTGAEHVVDVLIGGTMSKALQTRAYPAEPGEQRVFLNRRANPNNPLAMPRPESVIVVGLGDEGSLSPSELARTVERGVISWAQRRLEKDAAGPFEIAATLVGSGGAGISAGGAARAIVTGVRDANERLAQGGWPVAGRLLLIEVYNDRAAEAWRELEVQREATKQAFQLAPTISKTTGWLLQPLESDYRGANYDLVTATTRGSADASNIYFTIDTRRARAEVRAQATQVKLVRELVKKSAVHGAGDGRVDVGKTLFQLLVPVDVRPFLAGNGRVVLQLDEHTAAIPWELLNTDAETDGAGLAQDPWAIRSRLLRKFETTGDRKQPADAREDDHVLVVGNPKLTDPRYLPLKAAVHEANEVSRVLQERYPGQVTALTDGADAIEVMNAVFARRYRVVHIAAHGELGEGKGVVLSDGIYLSAKEFPCMQAVPELVFINCCHLAAATPGASTAPPGFDAAQFAASVAYSLIKDGVRCVVAAGWAIGDAAAAEFARAFYQVLLQGRSFQDAVAEARMAARSQGDNTWAAYQCYGDPDWRLVRSLRRKSGGATASDFDFPTAASVRLYLDTLASKVTYDGLSPSAAEADIDLLVQRAGACVAQGDVAEAFGNAYSATGAVPRAIAWYRTAIGAPDPETACSFRASEQLANLLGRNALEALRGQTTAGARPDFDVARTELAEARTILDQLVSLKPTGERLSLRGSVFKRRALVERMAARLAASEQRPDDEKSLRAAELEETARMKDAYEAAEKQAVLERRPRFYPGQNRLAAELILGAHGDSREFCLADLPQVLEDAMAHSATDPDFWSVAAISEIKLYEAYACGKFDESLPALLKEYEDLHRRVPAPRHWASLHDTAEFAYGRAEVANRYPAAVARLLEVLRGFAQT